MISSQSTPPHESQSSFPAAAFLAGRDGSVVSRTERAGEDEDPQIQNWIIWVLKPMVTMVTWGSPILKKQSHLTRIAAWSFFLWFFFYDFTVGGLGPASQMVGKKRMFQTKIRYAHNDRQESLRKTFGRPMLIDL